MTGKPDVPPDHIGWDLVRAARAWEAEFIREVVEAGHPWFAEARGRILQHIGRNGVGQADLVRRSGLTKQAVAQHLDQLEADGVLRRVQDPADSRKRAVEWTVEGRVALETIDAAKLRVERRIKDRIGKDHFSALRDGLKVFVD